ncbi:retrotrans_gag domain-containing protein [Trichonephila clavipes]|nr:retrotrans_gag domain-containing protein [Trichonephila clavipes]
MPTEQEAKPAVVTPSLQQWRSPSTFRGAPGEDPLKWLKKSESTQSYIQSVLGLCQEVNPLMKEDEKVSHLMKGVAEDIYQALLTREINDTASFIKWCNYIEDMKQKRVGRPRFERLPNVVPVASLTDETDLVSLIHTIVREEVHRLVNQTQESLDSDPQSLEEIVQDEVERVLAPVSTKPTETRPRPTYATVTRKYRAPVQKFHLNQEKQIERLSLTTLETTDGTSTTLALKKKYADQTLLAVLCQVPREADPQYVVTDPRRHIADPVSRQAVGARKTKESDLPRSHDVILGWDFLEAFQAVIDCGQNELVLEDICRDSTAPDAWNLYATRDYTLKPHSLTRITVSGYQTRGDINVVLDGSKHLLFEKNIATPSMVSTYRNGKVMSGLPTCSSETKSSLEECA